MAGPFWSSPTCFSNSTEPGFSSFWCVSRRTLCTVPSISPAKTTWPPSQDQGHSKGSEPWLGSGLFISHLLTPVEVIQKTPRTHSLPVGSLKTTLASIVLRVRDLIITAMLGTLFLGSCLRAACLQGDTFTELAMPACNSSWQPRNGNSLPLGQAKIGTKAAFCSL